MAERLQKHATSYRDARTPPETGGLANHIIGNVLQDRRHMDTDIQRCLWKLLRNLKMSDEMSLYVVTQKTYLNTF